MTADQLLVTYIWIYIKVLLGVLAVLIAIWIFEKLRDKKPPDFS